MSEVTRIRRAGTLRRFLGDFAAFAGSKGLLAALLVGAGAVVEGFGLVLIVPLLGIVIGSPQESGRIGAMAAAIFARLGIESPFGRLALLIGAFAAVMVLRAVIVADRDVGIAALQAGFVERLRTRMIERLAAARWDRLARLRHARVTQVMTSDVARVGAIAYQMLLCTVAATLLAVQGVVVVALAPALSALLLLGVLIVAAILLALGARRTYRLGGAATNANFALLSLTGDFLGGLKLALSQNLQAAFGAAFRRALHEQTAVQIAVVRQHARRRALLTTSAALLAAVVVLLGFGRFDIEAPVLIALLLVMVRMLGPAVQIQQAVQQIAFALPAFEKVCALESDLAALPAQAEPAMSGPMPDGAIVFRDVSYRHAQDEGGDDSRSAGVAHLNLTIMPGEFVGVTGPSGAGKTTFADLLVGLYPPLHGGIAIGDRPLTPDLVPLWQNQIGYVAQDAFLFHDTLRRNLSWSDPQADEAELWRVLELAGAAALVRDMPQGLETVVGERGTLLSGGERQRIALARAVLRRPALLILDEATSALDIESERAIIGRLRTLAPRPAIVVIAHRPETIAQCDRILRFDAGRCVDQGGAETPAPRVVAQR